MAPTSSWTASEALLPPPAWLSTTSPLPTSRWMTAAAAASTSDVRVRPWQQMASSGAGSVIVSLFMTPFDVVKVRLQAQDLVFQKKCFLYSNGVMDQLWARFHSQPVPSVMHTAQEMCNCKWYNRPRYINGTIDAFVKISRVEGVSSLWSGLSPTIVLAVPTTVIYITTYEHIRNAFFKHLVSSDGATPNLNLEHSIPMVSGMLARVWAVTLVSPLEMVRTKMQSKKMKFDQVWQALGQTVRSEGVAGLWRGYSATLYRDVPFSGLYWLLYEYFKTHSSAGYGYEFSTTFASGALAGGIASALTLPMDVIKTRRQIELGERDVFRPKSGPTPSTWAIGGDIVRHQGLGGLFTGLTPRVLKVAPACAIMISSYEFFKDYFQNRNAHIAASK